MEASGVHRYVLHCIAIRKNLNVELYIMRFLNDHFISTNRATSTKSISYGFFIIFCLFEGIYG